MASWVTHLRIANNVLMQMPGLSRRDFCVGSIAPDCNTENADWTAFTPPREVTHWMTTSRKTSADAERFRDEYLLRRFAEKPDEGERSFLLGYYTHLIVDAECQRYIRDPARVAAVWRRIEAHPVLSACCAGLQRTWDAAKSLLTSAELWIDFAGWEAEYLETHPQSGFLTEIRGLRDYPDYLSYLPRGAIVRKIGGKMGELPQNKMGAYPGIALSKEEYLAFVDGASELAQKALASVADEAGIT